MSFGSSARQIMGIRDVRLVLTAGLVSQTGDWALRTGIGFQIYVLTGSTVAAATVLLVSLAPQVLLGSIAGAYVDRWDRRRVMVVVNLLLAVVLAPLLVVDRPWLIYLLLALSSCLSPFFLAAEATMVPELITDPSLRITANAINSQVRDVSRLVGAALGGVLAATGGIPALALGDLISFLLAAGAIALIRRRPRRRDAVPSGKIRGELSEGFAGIRRSRPLAVILIFMIVTGLGEAIMGTLFAPFVHDLLRGGAADFGRIVAAQAIGGILGGVLVSLTGHRHRPATLFGWGAVLFGLLDLALFCYPLVAGDRPPVWPAMMIIALVGLPGAALVAGMTTTLQNATTDRVRGRVFGTVTAAQNGAMLGITLVVGLITPRLGIVTMLVGQGLGYVLAGVLVVVALRRIDPAPAAPVESRECQPAGRE